MDVIRLVLGRKEFVLLIFDDAGDVFLEFIFVLAWNETLTTLNSKDKMDIELCVGVRHLYVAPTELRILFGLGSPG